MGEYDELVAVGRIESESLKYLHHGQAMGKIGAAWGRRGTGSRGIARWI